MCPNTKPGPIQIKLGRQRQQHARIHMWQSKTLYDLLLYGMHWYRKDCEVVYRNKTKPYYNIISTTTNQHTLYQIGRLHCALVKQCTNTANYYGNQHHHTLHQILPPSWSALPPGTWYTHQVCTVKCEPTYSTKVYRIPIILAQGADNHNMRII